MWVRHGACGVQAQLHAVKPAQLRRHVAVQRQQSQLMRSGA